MTDHRQVLEQIASDYNSDESGRERALDLIEAVYGDQFRHGNLDLYKALGRFLVDLSPKHVGLFTGRFIKLLPVHCQMALENEADAIIKRKSEDGSLFRPFSKEAKEPLAEKQMIPEEEKKKRSRWDRLRGR